VETGAEAVEDALRDLRVRLTAFQKLLDQALDLGRPVPFDLLRRPHLGPVLGNALNGAGNFDEVNLLPGVAVPELARLELLPVSIHKVIQLLLDSLHGIL